MIRVIYSTNDDHYTKLDVRGHADFDEYGKDLICASVSSIIFGLMNAVDESKCNVEVKELNNHIEIINNSKSELIDNYFELVLIQLKTIEESYGEFIKVERK